MVKWLMCEGGSHGSVVDVSGGSRGSVVDV